MTKLICASASVDETQAYARRIAELVQAGDCFILSGDLGAGKTHFAQGFARGLGIDRAVASPTFNIVLTYPEARIPLYHFDVYRLEHASELEDIDFYALVEGDGVSLVEWGEKFDEAIDEADVHVTICSKKDEPSLSFGQFGEESEAAGIAVADGHDASRTIQFEALTKRGKDILAILKGSLLSRN